MNKNLQNLLRLDGLVLTRKGLELTGSQLSAGALDDLNREIDKLRRRLPAEVISQYDRLTQKYSDPLAALTGDVCQGCQQRVSRRRALIASHTHRLFQCDHCERFIFAASHAPDYVR